MYEFHYDFMKSEVDIFTLLYTDTDSYEIMKLLVKIFMK